MDHTYLGLLVKKYRAQLHVLGVPLDPAKRTVDQQATAAMTLWVLAAAAQLEVEGLTTDSVDKE